MIDTTEITETIQHLERTFDELMLRGLRAAGPGEINSLSNIKDECERIGAYHLASRIEAIVDAINSNNRSGAAALMKAQTSLRLFDRILTLEVAQTALLRGIGSEHDGEVQSAGEGDDDDV
ncbi:MAG: hypothetical protein K2X93_07085 [Candidatus Obscuribacterales bacterium]|nr:hypothetical protein [Candidatus Obscuribacterales bacterium]